MSFVHEDPEFADLLRIVARERGLSTGLVEKDYWVTHALWAVHTGGLEVWFKGGTSLSKGFALIERFSEDLDLKVNPGSVSDLPTVSSWTKTRPNPTAQRKAYFEALAEAIRVPGAEVSVEPADSKWRQAIFRVTYPGRFLADLGVMRPFVQLEVGDARVRPFVLRDLTSFVHAHLEARGELARYGDNRPRAVRCLHPLVTLLEKIDALHNRFETSDPAEFVRHYEDAARVIRGAGALPPLDGYDGVASVAAEMLEQGQIKALPTPGSLAFAPVDDARWSSVRAAHAAIGPMFWGARISLEEACATIRAWATGALGA